MELFLSQMNRRLEDVDSIWHETACDDILHRSTCKMHIMEAFLDYCALKPSLQPIFFFELNAKWNCGLLIYLVNFGIFKTVSSIIMEHCLQQTQFLFTGSYSFYYSNISTCGGPFLRCVRAILGRQLTSSVLGVDATQYVPVNRIGCGR